MAHHRVREANDGYAADRNAIVDELVPAFTECLKTRPQCHVILIIASPQGYTVASDLPTDTKAVALAKYILAHHEKVTA
jgi:hypothetical protein